MPGAPDPNGRLSAAVIGAGAIAEEHLRYLTRSGRARLAAVCDRSAALAEHAAGRFRAKGAFTDHREMLARARPEVVHVLTPPPTHAEIASDCLDAGAHVILEKPAALSHGESEALWKRAELRGRRLVEDHNYRFNEPVLEIERLLGLGALGEVREVDVRMALHLRVPGNRYGDANLPHPSHRLPGGVVHEFLPHLSYLALRFLPGVERVSAVWSNHGGPGDAGWRYDDLDALVVGGGVHARLRFSCITFPESLALTVRGSRGTASAELYQPQLELQLPRAGGKSLTPVVNQWVNGWRLLRAGSGNLLGKLRQRTAYEGLAIFLERTYQALESGAEPPVTHRDMDRCSRLIDALLDERERR